MSIRQKFQFLKHRVCINSRHYYSPLPSRKEISEHGDLFDYNIDKVAGINLRFAEQKKLLEKCQQYYDEMIIKENTRGGRYSFENNFYSYADGIFYYFILRLTSPRKVVEIGSGFSSALLLDINDNYFGGKIQCIFIEPYAKRLKSLLKKTDEVNIYEKRLQDVELSVFEKLEKGDILFIDSTHVVKTNSDVNYIFSKILPCLNEGVYIHFHDIFYPFEYPQEHLESGWAWNEDYMLRSFLQYNDSFEIVLWNHYFITKAYDWIAEHMPLCLKNTGGSIWIRRK